MDTLKTSVAQRVWAVSRGEKKTNAIVIAPIKNNSMFKTTEWFEIDFLKLKALFQNSNWHSWNVGIITRCKRTSTVFPTTFLQAERYLFFLILVTMANYPLITVETRLFLCCCRSTSAKLADRLSLQERTFPDPLQTETDFTNTKLYVLFINWTYLINLIRSIDVLRLFIQIASNRHVLST